MPNKLAAVARAARQSGWHIVEEPAWDIRHAVGSIIVEQPAKGVWLIVGVNADNIAVLEIGLGHRGPEERYGASFETLDEAVEKAVSRIKRY